MNLVLTRKDRRPDGIFSWLMNDAGSLIAYVLEHAYPVGTAWEPKVPNGAFQCVRGVHRLEGMLTPFGTFEVTGVEGHKDILFHSGNRNADSAGCLLLGAHIATDGKAWMITNSRATFAEFMELQRGADQFTLTVQG